MRYLPDVLDLIFAEIPDDFDHKESLSLIFGSIKESYIHSPPEAKMLWWSKTAIQLQHFLGEVDEDWKQRISDIFAVRTKADWIHDGF